MGCLLVICKPLEDMRCLTGTIRLHVWVGGEAYLLEQGWGQEVTGAAEDVLQGDLVKGQSLGQ